MHPKHSPEDRLCPECYEVTEADEKPNGVEAVISFWLGPVMIGLFPYWIGFSFRNPEPYRTIDLGYIKFMWT